MNESGDHPIAEGLAPDEGTGALAAGSAAYAFAMGETPAQIASMLDMDPERLVQALGRMGIVSTQADPTGQSGGLDAESQPSLAVPATEVVEVVGVSDANQPEVPNANQANAPVVLTGFDPSETSPGFFEFDPDKLGAIAGELIAGNTPMGPPAAPTPDSGAGVSSAPQPSPAGHTSVSGVEPADLTFPSVDGLDSSAFLAAASQLVLGMSPFVPPALPVPDTTAGLGMLPHPQPPPATPATNSSEGTEPPTLLEPGDFDTFSNNVRDALDSTWPSTLLTIEEAPIPEGTTTLLPDDQQLLQGLLGAAMSSVQPSPGLSLPGDDAHLNQQAPEIEESAAGVEPDAASEAGAPHGNAARGYSPYGLLAPDADPAQSEAFFAQLSAQSAGPALSMPGGPSQPNESADQGVGVDGIPSFAFDVEAVRKDFPILSTSVHGKPLIWLDNAATTQKPQQVIDAMSQYYAEYNSNIHRGAHSLAARATDAYEDSREKIQRFIGAQSANEIVFVRGTTEGMNLIANTYGHRNVGAGDEIIVSQLEHHSNIVPWQMLAKEKGATIKVAPVNDSGEILLDAYEALFTPRTRIVAVTQASNALGTVPPVETMIDIAHRRGVVVVVDGAQSVPHTSVDVSKMDCDFFVFSGHKLFAPLGVGVVYGKKAILDEMPPWQGGGNMIRDVSFEQTEYEDPPNRFEAGTPSIADVIGLGAAIDYLNNVGMENVHRYEQELLAYATGQLARVPGIVMYGPTQNKIGVISFLLDGVTTDTVGKELDAEGIAVRVGHHCAQPILRRLGVEATIRPSLAFYNTRGEVDKLVEVLIDITNRHRA